MCILAIFVVNNFFHFLFSYLIFVYNKQFKHIFAHSTVPVEVEHVWSKILTHLEANLASPRHVQMG